METGGNSYVMPFRHTLEPSFYNSSVTLDFLGQGQEVILSILGCHTRLREGAGLGESVSLTRNHPLRSSLHSGGLIRDSLSDPSCWVRSLGLLVGGGERLLVWARYHLMPLAPALVIGLFQHPTGSSQVAQK